MIQRWFPALLLVIGTAVSAAACSPAAAPPTGTLVTTGTLVATAVTDAPDAVNGAEAVSTSAGSAGSPLEAVALATEDRPAWETTPLINAATGETFTLADFRGKTVYVEPMATWCTNCRAQQQDVRAVKAQLGDDRYVFVSLSVEPNDTTPGLAEYAVRENFPWVFAIAPADMIRALVDQFGRTITTPPSTPHFIISPDGMISTLATGHHTADQLVAQLTAAAGA